MTILVLGVRGKLCSVFFWR